MPSDADVSLNPAALRSSFLEDVWRGLSASPKFIPPKYFYDRTGSELFERICELDEYYLTRTELDIMDRHAQEMAEAIGGRKVLLELGSGASVKTRLLLDALREPAAYVPLDISRSALEEAADRLSGDFPDLNVVPVQGDFMREIPKPEDRAGQAGTVVYFPGSTIGNLSREETVSLLKRIRNVCDGGGLLLGVDLQKEAEILERAYNDARGVTAAFNLNLLERINRELDGDFDVRAFTHHAEYNADRGRVEIFLVSQQEQSVQVAGREFFIEEQEAVCTEHSHKFTFTGLAELAQLSGFQIATTWTDENEWFAVVWMIPDR
jgi:dimethylhistidine N-methyltransferase